MKVYVSLDENSYREKPEKNIVRVRYDAAKGWQRMELSELAVLVGNQGHAIIPGHMVGGLAAKDCTAMQLFALDFDHGCNFQEIKSKCDSLGIPIAFAYHTYSSSEREERFRIVFAHETLINDTFAIKVIIAMFHKIFPESDSACKNLDRLFLGGKKLIYMNENARFALVQLLTPFYQAMSVGGNRKRNLRTFCKRQKILMYNDTAAMGAYEHLSLYGEIDEITERAIIHIIGESTNPSFFILESVGVHQSLTYKKRIRKLSIKGGECQLLNDFSSGHRLGHNACFALLTNLTHISGGQKHFFEIMEAYYGSADYEKWKKDIFYMVDYHPQRCSEEFCPYYDSCNHAGTIVNTLAMDRKVYVEKETYYSLEESRECLEENLETALHSTDTGIHLIRAQTAIGKTTLYTRLIRKYSEKKFLIAVPTNLLKAQVEKDVRREGVSEEELLVTVSTQGNSFFPEEIREAIAEAHGRGCHDETKNIIKEYYNEIKDDPSKRAIIKECELLLKGFEAFKDKRVVVTTHAYLLNIPKEILEGYVVIIDEDILQLQIFNKIMSVSICCLEEVIKKKIPVYSDIASELLQAGDNEYQKIEGKPYAVPLTQEQLDELGFAGEGNINDLRYAESFVKLMDRESGEMVVQYFCPQKMHRMKYIILSATLNEKIYQSYFQGQMEVYSYPEKKANILGKILQFTHYSLGRRDLLNHMEVFLVVRKLSGNSKLEIITFKMIERIKGGPKTNTKGLHFGNAIGVNSLKGCDLGIVGTPYKTEEPYKLVACYLGADVNQEVDKRPKPRRVTYKNFNFLITTYREPLLQEVQLYALESELEQCVGRARVLRADCTVYVFSAFPCEQAEIHMEDYLKEEK